MRKITIEEHEFIFNLFIMYFSLTEIYIGHGVAKTIDDILEDDYMSNINHGFFKVLKCCFPMNEICDFVTYPLNGKIVYESVHRISEV